jgi:hypothetical protein
MLPIVASIVSNLISNGMPKVADAVIEKGVEAVEDKLGIKLKPEGEATPEDNAKLKEAAMKHEEFMAELDEKSRQRATDMQISAMKSEDWLVRRFVYLFAAFWAIMACLYIGFITFADIPEKNLRFVDTILGVVIGGVITTLLSFFYGSSQGSRAKDEKK